MNRNLRVLFVNRMACIERGGGETFDLEISRHLARIGAQVSFLSGAPLFSPPPLPVDGASVLHTPWLKLFPWDKIKGGWRLRVLEFEWFELRAARWLRRHADQFDVVQVCELPNFVLWSKNLGVDLPFVLRLTAPNFHDPRGGVRRADALVASGTSIESLRSKGLSPVDVPNAVDSDLFRPQPSSLREKLGIAPGDFVAVYVARFQAFKNHAMLVDAFARFAQNHPSARLLLAGGGPLENAVRGQVANLRLSSQVFFLGETPHRDLPAVYAAADVGVVSSDYESFCFAALEAMATALPVLTTDCAWVPRLVGGGAGIVVPVGDPAAFADALASLADNPSLRVELSAAGRARVLERHAWSSSAAKLMDLYRRLVDARPRA